MRRFPLVTKVLLALVVVLICARVAAPYIIEHQINASIARQPDLSGGVADVDLMLWRGGIAVDGIEIFKPSVSSATPLFAADRAEASIRWRSLLAGGIVTNALVFKPRIQLLATSDADAKDDAKELKDDAKKLERKVADPQSPIGELLNTVPIKVDRFEVVDGSLLFKNADTRPPLEIALSDVDLRVSNLTNTLELSDSLIAELEMTATAQGSGQFSLSMNVNPNATPVDFSLRSKLLGLEAKAINPFTKEYGKFDFERGSIDVVTEMRVRDGHVRGYVKPLLRDIEISSRADATRDEDSLLRQVWEAIVGATEHVVENSNRIQSGTRIPIEGKIDAPGTDLFAVATEVLRNAYVRALLPRFEGRVAH